MTGVEVLSGLMFLVAVPDRSAKTLFEYMKRYIRKGSIVTVGKERLRIGTNEALLLVVTLLCNNNRLLERVYRRGLCENGLEVSMRKS